MRVLAYTFRTYPHQDALRKIFPNVFVIDALKSSLAVLKKHLEQESFDWILGIAQAQEDVSVFEAVALNSFHKKGVVIKSASEKLFLDVPDLNNTVFQISDKGSDSFCNYAMYTIAHICEKKNIKTPCSFVHVCERDVSLLQQLYTR